MSRILLAVGSVPKDGGTFTFYRNLRPALFEHGIDMRCITIGREQARLRNHAYVDDGCVLLAPDTRDIRKQAIDFAKWCEEEQADVVMGINSEAILSALPHLPEHIRILSRCANGFDHGYKITLSGGKRLARIVAVTPRLADDLIHHYGAEASLVETIPNGIDPKPFEQASISPRGKNSKLRLGFLGRLENNQKGIFHLPKIIRELNTRGVPFQLDIAGKGRHRKALEREMVREIKSGQVRLLGQIPPKDVPGFLAGVDVFIFPSHIEGCPNALLEAMMAGCVPIAWRIEGITDFIIEERLTGFVCPTGDYPSVAQLIENLARNRDQLQAMSKQVSASARHRFTSQVAASAYAGLIKEVMAEAPPPWKPKPWSEFTGDPNFDHGWREYLQEIALFRWIKEKM